MPITLAPAGEPGRKGLLVAGLSVAALVVVGFFVWLFVFALGGSGSKPASTTTPTTAPTTMVKPPAGQGRSSDTAFASIPGYTLKAAPASVLAQIRSGFDQGMKSAFAGTPGVSVNPDQVIAGISGRVIVQSDQEVGLAIAISFDDRWAARIPADQFSPIVGKTLGPSIEEGTVAGQSTVFVDTGDTADLLAYKDGTFLIVIADSGDRATLNGVMTGLLQNLG